MSGLAAERSGNPNTVNVFWQDAWHTVDLPKTRDQRVWSAACDFVYGITWMASVAAGKGEVRAEQLAEAAVFKRLYPGVVFDSVLEGDLVLLMQSPSETT
jgi:hypothetical protein